MPSMDVNHFVEIQFLLLMLVVIGATVGGTLLGSGVKTWRIIGVLIIIASGIFVGWNR